MTNLGRRLFDFEKGTDEFGRVEKLLIRPVGTLPLRFPTFPKRNLRFLGSGTRRRFVNEVKLLFHLVEKIQFFNFAKNKFSFGSNNGKISF